MTLIYAASGPFPQTVQLLLDRGGLRKLSIPFKKSSVNVAAEVISTGMNRLLLRTTRALLCHAYQGKGIGRRTMNWP
jgi:hypothetical protein